MNIQNYIKAGYPAIYCVTNEEVRLQKELVHFCKSIARKFFIWSCTEGMILVTDKTVKAVKDTELPEAMLAAVSQQSDIVVLLRDMHMLWEEPNPGLIRMLKEAMPHMKSTGVTLIISACRQMIPSEIEKEFVVVDIELPNQEEIIPVLTEVANSASVEIDINSEQISAVIDNARGMTLNEAENAFALSLVEKSEFDPKLIYREKSQVVKKNGLLEIVETTENIDDIGGLDLLKDYLSLRACAFTKKAKDFGLPTPKGLLIIGIPGTGKSLTAKATSNILKNPILRMDAGKIFGSLVGESEANLRAIIKTAEAVAPCILFIDEIEKGFSGGGGSNVSDGGTSNRVFGSFLTWLQEKTAPVFVVATANDISALRPEFLRTGRFDQIFFVDLPQKEELIAIWNIQISKHIKAQNIEHKLDFPLLAELCDGYTGAEIEQIVIESLFEAYNTDEKITMELLKETIQRIVPLSKTMHEQIDALRAWSHDRARPASTDFRILEKAKGPKRKIHAT